MSCIDASPGDRERGFSNLELRLVLIQRCRIASYLSLQNCNIVAKLGQAVGRDGRALMDKAKGRLRTIELLAHRHLVVHEQSHTRHENHPCRDYQGDSQHVRLAM